MVIHGEVELPGGVQLPEGVTLRRATLADAPICAQIYAHYVRTSNATFETEVPSDDEMRARMETRLRTHDWIVVVEAGHDGTETILGYAYASPFRDRMAYDWSIETTIYLHPDAGRRGLGTALYSALLHRMTEMGFHTAIALVAVPNDASEALHRRMGFTAIGTFAHSGFKLQRWHDVRFYQRMLVDSADTPPAPIRRG